MTIPGMPVIGHMVVAGRWCLCLSILGAKVLHESAARMVSVVSLVLFWWLMSMVTQHEAVIMYIRN
jgi:hypothetical protein